MRRLVLGLIAAASVAAIPACTAGSDCDFGLCSGGTTAAGDGGDNDGSTVGPPTGCDPNTDPKDAPNCVVDTYGVFVSPSGDDSQSGTTKAPLKTIATAVRIAGSKGLPRVYVCEGTYSENVTISGNISIYGGFACTDFAGNGSKATIRPQKGVAVTVRDVAAPGITLSDLDVFGLADMSTPGDSAIGILVSNAVLTVKRSNVVAGPGAPGRPGITSSNWSGAASVGVNASGPTGGAAPTCDVCKDGKSQSGGGAGGPNSGQPGDGTATPPVGEPNAGANSTSACLPGTVGANGRGDGTPGAGATTSGSLTANGWVNAADAQAGGIGNPGQGGGGGGSRSSISSGGGSGGCGGCGGGGGSGGANGGASFGVVSFASDLTIVDSKVTSGDGGEGGAGGAGQDGQDGAKGGAGACAGGDGGHGAGGSGGGGGGGGPAAAIAYTKAPAVLTNATLVPGTPGKGGKGGSPGAGAGNPGKNGMEGPQGSSADQLSF